MTKFEELLAKYGKTAEDVTFDYEGMADKELEVKFAEMFDDNSDNEDSENPSNDNKEDRSLKRLFAHMRFLMMIYDMLYISFCPSLNLPTMIGILLVLFMTIILHTRIGMAIRFSVRIIQKMVIMLLLTVKDTTCIVNF